MFTLDWVKEIDTSLPTMIVVSGVYQYFDEGKIIEMIKKMKSLILKGELVFDATNSTGLKLANKYVQKTGNVNAKMYFSVDNVDGFFDGALKHCEGLKFLTRIYMYFADKLHRTLVVHLKFN